MKLTDFKALTFDVYGTLIDWESGVVTCIVGWLKNGESRLQQKPLPRNLVL